MAKLKVTLTTVPVVQRASPALEHDHVVHIVVVTDGSSEWREEFPTMEQTKLFLRGIKAGAAMLGDFIDGIDDALTRMNH